MSRRISLFLGTVLLVLALCCAVALADTVESGTLNDGVTWTLDSDGVLSFSGSGEIRNSLDDSLRQKAKTVFFGPGITYIEPGRFSYSYNLTSFTVDPANPNYTAVNGILYNKNMTELVECPTAKTGDLTVPATVTAIDHDAFIGNHLLSVTLPDNLETIGSQAFWNSEYLTEIALPASYTRYSTSVFNGCDELTMFTVAEANTEYAALNGLLYSKDLHTLIRVPGGVSGALTTAEGVTEIYSCAFERCGKLTSVTLSEGVTAIGGGAFSYSAVTTVSLPASLTTISRGAFNNADALENVYYAGTKADWSNVQVGEQNASLQSLIIHCQDGNITPQPMTGNIGAEEDEVTYILTVDGTLTVSGAGRWTSWAFMNNKKIKTAVLESGVTEIGWGAFDWCENLTGIVIPNTVTEIMFEAFYGCKSLETVTIPASVTELGDEVFDACSALQSITFGGTLAEWQALTEETDNRKLADISIYCSDGSIEQKWTGTCGENLTWELKNGVMTISGTGPMDNYSWDADHWENKEEIRSVVIEEGVTSVGELAFYTCPVASVSLPDSLTEIGSCAFYVCDLESVIIPKNVETIGTWAFSANSDLTAIQVAEGNANFSSYDGALYNKDQTVLLMCPAGKKSVSLPNTVVNIDGAFQACHNLISVVLPEGITGIGSSTFNNLNDLTGITIPASVTVIEYNAFGNCPSLTDITYAGTKAAWAQINIGAANDPLYGEACTVHCTDGDIHNEKTMEWSKENGVLTITGTGPMDNYELQAGRQAPWRFESSDVTEIQIGQGMTSIGNYAFRYMMTLTKITIPDTVKYVGQFAFDNCSSLADVYFGGTREQWHGINITTGNTMLNAAEIHCTDGDIEGMPKLATPNITVKPATIQLGAAFTVDAEYDEEANYSTLMVYDGNGRYIGFQNTTWDQIVYTRWPNDCKPGTYRATLTSYRQGYRNSDPAEFEFTVTAGERPAAPTVTVSPATPVKKEAITFLFDGTYDRINIDLYRADGSRYSGNDAANTDRYVWPNGLAAGNWIVQASVCVDGIWSFISETPFTVGEGGSTEDELEIVHYDDSCTYYISDLSTVRDEQGRFSRDSMLIQFRIDAKAYNKLKESIGGEPEWSCETVEGDAEFDMVAMSNGQYANLVFATRPNEACEATVKVHCSWGTLSDETQVTIEAKTLKNGLPEGIQFSFGDTMIIKKGVTLPMVTSFTSFINNWSIEGEDLRYGYYYTPWDAVSDGQFNTPGIYGGYAELNYGNIVCGRSYTIIVTDEDGTLAASLYEPVGSVFTLPDSLTTIGSEAFAGTSIRQIDIPETVTSIAEDAFDGCGLVAIYAHNPYVLEWAVDHGFVALVD